MFGLGRKKTTYHRMPEGDYEPVLRCSICTGEQTLCARDRKMGKGITLTAEEIEKLKELL